MAEEKGLVLPHPVGMEAPHLLGDNTKILPPPWLAYPEIERYSIGWRMGFGEDYIGKFWDWYDALAPEGREEYRSLFPEPTTWRGWWQGEDTGDVLAHGDFCIPLWRPEGKPKYSLQQLQKEWAGGKKADLCLFWGHQPPADGGVGQGCLSQWWMADFWSAEQPYCCMEQYMMAAKAELFGDDAIRQQILECREPRRIKALGRAVRGFDAALWDTVKYSIVLNGNYCKFSQNRVLRDFLLATGDGVLVEASPFDSVWGIHLAANSPKANDPAKWQGLNLLGFALMEVRDALRQITRYEYLCDWTEVI